MDKAGILDRFVAKLSEDSNVLAVILFGSYARGDSRPDSDIDLVVILKEGFKRAAEIFDGQAFEIIYTTEGSAKEYWTNNKHDAVNLWSVAKVIFDRGGIGQRLAKFGKELLAESPPELDGSTIEHLKFDIEDSFKAIDALSTTDQATTALLLHKKVAALIELHFDLRREWRPAPKQLMERIRKSDPELAKLVSEFYAATGLSEQIRLAKTLSTLIF